MSDSDRIGRRDALVRLSSAGLAVAGVTTGVLAFGDRRAAAATGGSLRDWRVTGHSGPLAAAAHGKDPVANVHRALEAMGGMSRFVKKGEVVLVKPNVGWNRLPEQGANTDPRVVAALVKEAKAAGAKRVIVADVSCNNGTASFIRSGILDAAEAAGAEVIYDDALEMVDASLPGVAGGLRIMKPLLEADRVINVPVPKHHELSRVTLGMKNWFGAFGTGRNRLHQGIDGCIAELCGLFRPTLTVVDATRVMMRNGPTGGSLSDVKTVDAVLAGLDPVLCDAWGAAQLGVAARELGFIVKAEKDGLGRSDLAAVKDLGTT